MNDLYLYVFEGGELGVSGLPPLDVDRQQIADGVLTVLKLDILNGGPSVCELDENWKEHALPDVFPDETNSYHEP